ncbi:RagB/SusD family nutrient uptake outer membrane protein [Capnocytophaga stomatis]|uniref:RagB/SusD family nutrient uptake outer membrane protein n=1 Tax=Capnocytophaga stomatis TaxID=1848904 RepID=A0ABW8QB05_9FLAO|nr:RagB/SusD family nutrient uptake outer membrane protein [Capnocytophaga stomatis]GIJ94849.1 membrane protein [Capnocytophaga stomatis]GIJ97519.1 membrane protein [Capnocytophaga stomatis]GIM50061.1 membrane protein [Capnocytophaga stomatis]
MKLRYKISAIVLGAMAFVGCESLDQQPFNSLSGDSALQTVKDAEYWANGFYSGVRGVTYGRYLLASEIQADMLNASVDYGNRYGQSQIWDVQTGNYDVQAYWQGRYGALKNINTCIDKFPSIAPANDKEAKALKEYTGEAYAVRAYYFFQLAQHFAKNYNPASASSDLGIPLVLKYDVNELPARATLEQTFNQILDDIAKAESLLATKAGAKGAKTFTLDAVKALKARVLLEKQDWSGAYNVATELIAGGKYPLVNTKEAFEKVWYQDLSDETIMQLSVSKPDELPNANSSFLGYNSDTKKYSPDFIPSQWVLDLYSDDDIRKSVYFDQKDLYLGAVDYKGFLVNKYPGNPELYTGVTNYAHAPKLFRIAEQYLIAAEAAYRAGDATNAAKYLNDLRAARGLSAVTVAGDALFQEIKNERSRELVFEGFRLNDLKRWGEGVKRHSPQSLDYIATTPAENFYQLERPSTHHMFVWPIPSRDQQLNGNIKQNDGY